MKIRTCSRHVARLSAAPGGSRRTQVGYLIARSGIPDGRTACPAD
ncbi:hypothetical protein [Streptomyces rubiginosohelvolus]|uniref:LuxR family transcriptional regulator n=1 Tax=Streptomyces globisporus C-1027 TaxID=1172567 RepID=A0A0U2T8T4_STRGL|nr:LuxR family transcriptional regulator [Streptomyces globisporus C-1027]OKJ18096.1 LuxR family transcriptional regulator [Streptomyces sp. CB02130]